MNAITPNIDPIAISLSDFEDMLEKVQQAAKDGDLQTYRTLDHQLRSMALAMIGGMPDLQPGDERYIKALHEAVYRLGQTAGKIEKDRRELKSRQGAERKVRLAYARPVGQG